MPVRPRDAASLVLVRGSGRRLRVLMGLRHSRYRFMPDVWVFPGGGVERGDAQAPLVRPLRRNVARPLEARWPSSRVRALAAAAVRETWEETGLAVGEVREGRLWPDLGPLRYLGRAITPAYSDVRYHARFFLAPAETARGRLGGNGELDELRWVPIAEARRLSIIDVTARMLDCTEQLFAGGRGFRPLYIHYRMGERLVDRE